MAQWDVYPNPIVRARDEIPYLVVLQSDLLDALPTRLVAPLSRSLVAATAPAAAAGADSSTSAASGCRAEGARGRHALRQRCSGRPVASLRAQSHLIVDALDAVVSGV